MNFVQKLWLLMRPFHKDMYVILAITTLFETVRLAGPFIFGKILDLLIATKGLLTIETAFVVVGGLAGVRLLSLIIDYLTDILIVRFLIGSERYVASASFNKLLQLSLDYHEKENTGTKINIVNKGKDKLVELLGSFTWEFQPIVLQLMITSILIMVTSWRVGIVFTLSLVPFTLFTFGIYHATKKLRSKRHDAYELSSGEIGDTISNITVVKAYAQEQREERSFNSIQDFIKSIFTVEFKKHIIAGFSRSLAVEFFYIVILLLGIVEIRAGELTVGSLVFLISLVERAYSNIYRLGRIYDRVSDASEPVNRISNLLQREQSIKNSENPIFPEEINGGLTFRHVTFSYNKRRVLKNVSFTIPAGSFTAIVGKSGGGKSTIAKLISRYYDPQSGAVLIDGKYDLRELDLDTFRRSTAVVFQDSPVPSRKIWEVIAYAAGKKSYSEVKDDVLKAAQLAHAHEFISDLSEGYQTEIGERGVRLSGGQRQRLAIARALFAEPKILLMDEPTSHLDTVSEAQIQQALDEISKERAMTKIVIAHRLSTVQKADQILVMDKGRLVEHGTHSQLLKKDGVYAQIVKQSELKG